MSHPNDSPKIYLSEDLMLHRLDCSTREEAISHLAKLLEVRDYVLPSFRKAVISRENEMPTGLETIPFGVAIPHTDHYHVKQSAIAVSTLRNQILFRNMANPIQELPVKVIFLLAIAEKESLPTILSRLASFFQSPEKLELLIEAESEQEMAELLSTEIGMEHVS